VSDRVRSHCSRLLLVLKTKGKGGIRRREEGRGANGKERKTIKIHHCYPKRQKRIRNQYYPPISVHQSPFLWPAPLLLLEVTEAQFTSFFLLANQRNGLCFCLLVGLCDLQRILASARAQVARVKA